MSGVERFGSNLTLLSLSFARRGDGNLTLSLCDVHLLQQGEGRFGESRNRVRSGQVGEKQQSQQGEKPHPVCFADIPLLHKGEGVATSPYCPSPSQGEGRFGESQNRVRSGRWARNNRLNKERNLTLSASQTSLSFARRGNCDLTLSLCDVPLLHKERDVLAKAETG